MILKDEVTALSSLQEPGKSIMDERPTKELLDTVEEELAKIKIEEAKWAQDVLIERPHELEEEQDMLKVLDSAPKIDVDLKAIQELDETSSI